MSTVPPERPESSGEPDGGRPAYGGQPYGQPYEQPAGDQPPSYQPPGGGQSWGGGGTYGDQPAYGSGDQPAYGSGDQPAYGDQPPYGGDQPAYGQPPYGQSPYGNQPPYGGEQPAYGNQPPYGGQYYGGGSGGGGPSTDPLAIGALVTSIIGVVGCCCFLGIVLGPAGAIMGFMSRRRIAESNGSLTGDGLALSGLIIGISAFVLSALYLILYFVSPATVRSSNF